MKNIRHMMVGMIGTTLAVSHAFGGERELDAHQHGHGVLNIAIEDQTLWIELEAPGADIVGFERPASSEEDKVAIETAKAKLGDLFGLFGIPANASCELDEMMVMLVGDEHEDHDEAGADADHHDDHNEADHHGGHAKEETHHTEFRAEYKIRCADLSEIETLPLRYFTVFPAAQELDVSVVTESGQHRQEVTSESATVQLSGD